MPIPDPIQGFDLSPGGRIMNNFSELMNYGFLRRGQL